jgi:hypothetical protein
MRDRHQRHYSPHLEIDLLKLLELRSINRMWASFRIEFG